MIKCSDVTWTSWPHNLTVCSTTCSSQQQINHLILSLRICDENIGYRRFPPQRASNMECVSMSWPHHDKIIGKWKTNYGVIIRLYRTNRINAITHTIPSKRVWLSFIHKHNKETDNTMGNSFVIKQEKLFENNTIEQANSLLFILFRLMKIKLNDRMFGDCENYCDYGLQTVQCHEQGKPVPNFTFLLDRKNTGDNGSKEVLPNWTNFARTILYL